METKERYCVKCGQIASAGRSHCEDCLAKAREYMRARKLRLIAAGKCTKCGREPWPATGSCDVCTGKRARTTHLDTSTAHDR